MSDTVVTERSTSPSFKITHLLTVEGVKSRKAKKEEFTSAAFSCSEDQNQTKFNVMLRFGSDKENFLSVYLKPLKKDVFVKECTIKVLDVNFNVKKSSTFKDQLVEPLGRGFLDFLHLPLLSLPDDTFCLRSEIIFVGAPSSDGIRQFSGRDANFDADLRKFFNDEKNTDVVIIVGGKKFKAHKALLEARSRYFRALFDSGMEESQKNEVPIDDADPEIFRHYLEFLYTGLPPTNSLFKVAWDLLPLADRFGAATLKRKCEGAIISYVSPTTAIKALALAHAHCCSSLIQKCLPLIRKNLKSLTATAEWKEMKKNADLVSLVLESYAE